jgi:hypothetical protein
MPMCTGLVVLPAIQWGDLQDEDSVGILDTLSRQPAQQPMLVQGTVLAYCPVLQNSRGEGGGGVARVGRGTGRAMG